MDKVKKVSRAIIEAFEKQINEDIDYIIALIKDILDKTPVEIAKLGVDRKHIAACAFINSGISEFVKSRIDAIIDFSENVYGFQVDDELLHELLEKICKHLDEKLETLHFNTILALCQQQHQINQQEFWETLAIITNKKS